MSETLTLLPSPDDPPLLRAMLLAAGNNHEVRAEIMRAYYGVMEGSKFSPFVLQAVLLSAIGNAILSSMTAKAVDNSDSGSKSPTMTPAQFFAINQKLEALPGKQDLQSLGDGIIKTLKAGQGASAKPDPAFIRKLEDLDFNTKELLKRMNSGVDTLTERPVKKWAKKIALWTTIALAGWVACFLNLQSQVAEARREADDRIDKIILSQPLENRFTSSLWAWGGGTPTIETVEVDGRSTQGIVIPPGTMTFGKPFIANVGKPGAAIVPLQ